MLFWLTLTFLASQLFAILALISWLISFQCKARKFIILFFIITAFCILLQFLLLERYVWATIVWVGMIRYFTAYYYPKPFLIPIFILIFAVLTIIFWKDAYDILAFLAASLNTLWSFQKNEKYLRYFFMTSWPCLIGYNYFIGSPMWMLLESVFLLSNIVGYYRYYISKK